MYIYSTVDIEKGKCSVRKINKVLENMTCGVRKDMCCKKGIQ